VWVSAVTALLRSAKQEPTGSGAASEAGGVQWALPCTADDGNVGPAAGRPA
jgi:hypothetical protein